MHVIPVAFLPCNRILFGGRRAFLFSWHLLIPCVGSSAVCGSSAGAKPYCRACALDAGCGMSLLLPQRVLFVLLPLVLENLFTYCSLSRVVCCCCCVFWMPARYNCHASGHSPRRRSRTQRWAGFWGGAQDAGRLLLALRLASFHLGLCCNQIRELAHFIRPFIPSHVVLKQRSVIIQHAPFAHLKAKQLCLGI